MEYSGIALIIYGTASSLMEKLSGSPVWISHLAINLSAAAE
jgi:hypothetical protein